MMKRAKSLGGSCNITPIKPKGLFVEVTLPIESELE
jgi:nitrate/nitrite-specific signal transduction histidine kinase